MTGNFNFLSHENGSNHNFHTFEAGKKKLCHFRQEKETRLESKVTAALCHNFTPAFLHKRTFYKTYFIGRVFPASFTSEFLFESRPVF